VRFVDVDVDVDPRGLDQLEGQSVPGVTASDRHGVSLEGAAEVTAP
jgi:hypothetical protein